MLHQAMKIGMMALALLSLNATAQTQVVQVKDAWARPAVPGQSGTGAFMTLNAPQGATLVGASSPAAGVTELHEMKMEGHMMKMHAVPKLALPAGHDVQLKSGGHHLMLMDLKQPIKEGEKISIELRVLDAAGKSVTVPVEVPVKNMATSTKPSSAAHGAHSH